MCHMVAVLCELFSFPASVAQQHASQMQPILWQPLPFAGPSPVAMHGVGWDGVSDDEHDDLSEDDAGWQDVALQEADDLSEDDAGWQDVALQEDGDVSGDDDAAVVAVPAPGAEPCVGHLGDLHGHGLPLELADPSLANDRSEWAKPQLLRLLHGTLERVRSAMRASFGGLVRAPSAEPLALDAPPGLAEPLALEDAGPSCEDSLEEGELADPAAGPIIAAGAPPRPAVDEAPVIADTMSTALCCAVECASALVCANPSRSDLCSASKGRVLQHYLFDKQHVMGYTVEAQHLGVGRKVLQSMMQASACAHLLLFRHDALRAIAQVHKQLIRQGAKAMLYTEHLRFDETPMRMRLQDPERQSAPDSLEGTQLAKPGSVCLPTVATCVSSHVAKILQTERAISLLYMLPTGKALHMRFRLPNHLQCMSSGKAEAYFRALSASRLQLPSTIAEDFAHRLHQVCTDGDAAVGRCIRAFDSQPGGFETLHTKCEIHKVYNWHKSVFNQVGPILSRLKHIALALTSGDSMRSFRAALREVLESCVSYRERSAPSSSDLKHNVACLDLFMPPTTATVRFRRALILSLANGPWQLRGKVVHNCAGCCSNRGDCVRKFNTFFVAAVAGTSPRIWPHARWLGAQDAIGWLGVLQCIHSLLELVFCKWADKWVGGPAIGAPVVGLMLADRVTDPVRLDACGQLDAPEENAESSGDENGPADGKPAKGEEVDWEKRRKEQSKYRFSGSEWLRTHHADATGVFMLIALVLRPLVTIMQQHLEVAGDGFETSQAIQEALGFMAGGAEAGGANGRVHRHGLLAYTNVFEEACLRSAMSLMQEAHHWSILPPHSRTAAFAARACILLSSIASHCHDRMVCHRAYPWKLFGLLVDASLEQEIMHDCKHMMDPWSRQLVAKCQDDGQRLTDPATLAIIAAVERGIRRETAQIEARHASIRRGLVGMSVQTHAVLFPHLSAGRLTQEVRRMSKQARPGHKPPPKQKEPTSRRAAEQPQPQQPQRRPSSGGAWRAFIRQETVGKVGSEVQTLSELGQRYRELSEEDRLEMQRQGREGTRRRQRGESFTFGEPKKVQHRRAQKQLRQEALEAFSEEKRARVDEVAIVKQAALQALVPIAEPAAAAPLAVWARLQELKRTLALEAEARNLREARRMQQLVKHMETHGKRELDACARLSPSLRGRGGEFIPEPSPLGDTCILDWSPVGLVRRVRQALSVADKRFESTAIKALLQTWAKLHHTIDYEEMPGVFEAPVRSACFSACACVCSPSGKLVQRFARKVDLLVKGFARPAAKRARAQLANGELVLLLAGQPIGEADLDADAAWGNDLLEGSPVQSARWLHIASHSFSPWLSGFSEMDAQAGLADEPPNLPGEAPLLVRGEFLTSMELALSVDLAATRWIGCLYEVVFSQTPLGTFRPNVLRVRKLPATMGLLWHPLCRRHRKTRKEDLGWDGVDDDSDPNEGELDNPIEDEPDEAIPDEDPLQLENDLGEPAAHPPDVEGAAQDLLGSLHEALDDNPLEASEDEASVGDAIDAALGDMGGAALVPDGEPAPMELGAPLAEEVAPAPLQAPIVAQGPRTVTLALPEGTISWYQYSGDFVAKCTHPDHAGGMGCRKHRTSNAGRVLAKGRPLGWLTAWLLSSHSHPTAQAHKSPAGCHFTLEERIDARAFLKAAGGAAQELLAMERAKREDEGSEPEQEP